MNWGYRILTVYLLFVTGIGSMAVMSFRQQIDMENENYYEAEKEQNNKMRQLTMGNAFKPLIKIVQDNKRVRFILPTDITEKPELEGHLSFLRPSDATLDKTISFTEIDNGELGVDKSELKPGFWKYSLKWEHPYGEYLIEDTLTVTK